MVYRPIFGIIVLFFATTHIALAASSIQTTSEVLKNSVPFDLPIVILGDPDHSKSSIRASIGQSLSSFREANLKLNCLFIESDRRMQAAIDSFLAAEDSSYQVIINARKQILGNTAYGFAGSEALLLAAKKEKVTVFAADIDFSSPLGKKVMNLAQWGKLGLLGKTGDLTQQDWFQTVVEERTKHFAEYVSKVILEKSCERSLIVIGSNHLEKTVAGIKLISLQEILIDKKLKSRLGLVISLNCEKPTADIDQKNFCDTLRARKSIAVIPENISLDDPNFILLSE